MKGNALIIVGCTVKLQEALLNQIVRYFNNVLRHRIVRI